MADLSQGFYSGDSLIHRIDPRIRLVTAGVFTLVAALVTDWRPALWSLIAGAGTLVLSRPGVRAALSRLAVLNVFVLFMWVIVPFTYPGTSLFSLGPFALTVQGLKIMVLLTLKANAVAMSILALVATIEPWALGRALQGLRVPDTICRLFMFTYRYVHVINNEYVRLRNAAALRGFRPGTNLHTYKTFAYLAGMLLVKSHERAERVSNAMVCRGFNGKFHTLSTFQARPADYLFLVLGLAVSVVLALFPIIFQAGT